MKILKSIKGFFYACDFFNTAELLRYRKQSKYRTVLGGVISVFVIAGLIALFYSKLIDTFQKIIITSDANNINAANPTLYDISTYPQNKFMFGVQIWHHDLNTGPRYFDMVLTSVQLDTGQRRDSSKQYPLEPCTLDHWQGFPQVQKDYERLKMNYWLCLPRNMKYNIQGKYASEFSQTLEVAVVKCTNESNPERPCANESEIQAYFQQQQSFFFTIYFINPLINPTSEEYITHYLEDNNYIIFTKNLGAEGIILMEQYTITTDQSILPYPTPRQKSGGFVSQFTLKNPYEVQKNVYCSFAFFKSGTSRKYERNFQRLDDILSYIGGLFGTIVILLFLVKLYNEFSFEIAFGAELLHSKNEKDQETLKQYNFFRFLFHGFYKFLQIFGCSPSWEIYQQFDDCQEEMVRQLDVVYLIKRIMLLQKAILTLLGEHQLKGLLLQQKLTLGQMKKKRKNFKIKRNLIQLGQKIKEKSKKSPKNRIEKNIQFFNSKVFNPSGLQSFDQMINPKESMRDESILRHQRENIFVADFYDSELSSSSSESDMENRQEIVQQLHQLKMEAINGDQVSEKIWQNCNKKMKNKIQYLISAEPNKIVSLNHLATESGLNSNSPQSSSSLKHARQRNGVNSNKRLTRRFKKKKKNGQSPQKTDSSVEGQKRKQQTIENFSDPVINQQNIIRIRSFQDFCT